MMFNIWWFCVLIVSWSCLVTSQLTDEGRNARANVTDYIRNKRYGPDNWHWSHEYPGHHHDGFNHNGYHYEQDYHNGKFDFNHHTAPQPQKYDPYTDPNSYLVRQLPPIPPKQYFNQNPITPGDQHKVADNRHDINLDAGSHVINIKPINPYTSEYHKQGPLQIFLNIHIHNNQPLNNGQNRDNATENIRNPPNQNKPTQDRPNNDFNDNVDNPLSPIGPYEGPKIQLPFIDPNAVPSSTSERSGASIDLQVLGFSGQLEGQIIGPTGVLVQDDGEVFSIQATPSCDQPYRPPAMPNFQKPGRKISEAKCYEYIFQLKIKDDMERRRMMCGETPVSGLNNNDRLNRRRRQDFQATVVGGKQAKPEEFAHMAAIGWRGVNGEIVFKCGGTVISPNFLITAAHCRSSAPDSTLADLVPRLARIGGNNIGYNKYGRTYNDTVTSSRQRRQTGTPGQVDAEIINVISHENYNPNRRYFDIALMQLATNLDFNRKIKPACLWTDLVTSKRIARAVATGWGVVDINTRRTSLQLQAGDLDIIDVDRCNQLLSGKFGRQFNGFADHQLCAGKLSGGVDVCQGDSGGPLQVKVRLPLTVIGNMHSIVGVISASPDCAKVDTPGIYTSIPSFIDWIEPKVWN